MVAARARGEAITTGKQLAEAVAEDAKEVAGASLEISLRSSIFLGLFGATRRIRTDDLLIMNQLLYQLS